jgi:hypothetical protein
MRTRIAQGAVRALAEPIGNIIHNSVGRPRRTAASFLVGSVVLIGVIFGPMMAGANHRFRPPNDHHRASNHFAMPRDALAAAYGRVPKWLRWLTAWKAEHPRPRSHASEVVLTDANSTSTTDWACIRLHESDDRFNTPGVPGGAYGFLEMTWLSLGYSGWPYEAPPGVQSRAALFLYNELGWQPWSTRFVCDL